MRRLGKSFQSIVQEARSSKWICIILFPGEGVLAEFLFGDEYGGFAIELGKHANGAGVGLLSPFPFPQYLTWVRADPSTIEEVLKGVRVSMPIRAVFKEKTERHGRIVDFCIEPIID